MMKIWIASDHAGLDLKTKVVRFLSSQASEKRWEIHDLGVESEESVDYPDYADAVCSRLQSWTLIDTQAPENSHLTQVGILICGSGQGMAMRANKYPYVRAALCWSLETAVLSREHNDANVLCLGSRLLDHELALKMTDAFLSTAFAGGRHLRRVQKVMAAADPKGPA